MLFMGNISVVIVGSSAAAVFWKALSEATSYSVDYSTDALFATYSTITTSDTKVAIEGLTAGTRYYFRVTARNASETSMPSKMVTYVTGSQASPSIIFLSHIALPNATESHDSPVRVMEFAMHTKDNLIHLPSGGTTGQILKMTTNGPAWVDE